MPSSSSDPRRILRPVAVGLRGVGVPAKAAESLVLELLAARVPLDELYARVHARRAEISDDADRARLDAALEHAVAVHRAWSEDRRQARGLAVLNDTAADLATLLELDEVLHAICRRARALLGTDAAYITLRDAHRGDTYVRATDGIVSEAFRHMRLPWGKGIGGRVARDGVPATTADYAADGRFAHTDDVDGCVTAEGLRGIVAAPLRRGDEVLGVVFTGSRSIRRFEPGEVALFASLATHAAIAIENARLFEDARRSSVELDRVQQRASSDTEQRLRTELLADIVGRDHRADAADLARRAAGLGVDLDVAHVVLVADVVAPAARWADVRAALAAAAEQGLAGPVGPHFVVLVPGTDPAEVAARWSATLTSADGRPPSLGASRPARGVRALREGHEQAERVLGVLVALGRDGQAATLDDLGLFGNVFGHGERGDLQTFMSRSLAPVLEHDATRGTALEATLEAFFAASGHLARTARDLGVHINTLYLRLERVDALLGDGWRSPDGRLELHLALRLRALDERLGQDGRR